MSMLTRHEAARLMEVPVAWVDAFIEVGALEPHDGLNGETLIDADEIVAKRYAAQRFEAASLAHVHALLKKLGVGRPAANA